MCLCLCGKERGGGGERKAYLQVCVPRHENVDIRFCPIHHHPEKLHQRAFQLRYRVQDPKAKVRRDLRNSKRNKNGCVCLRARVGVCVCVYVCVCVHSVCVCVGQWVCMCAFLCACLFVCLCGEGQNILVCAVLWSITHQTSHITRHTSHTHAPTHTHT